jgi:hypothetical protein
MVSPVPQQGATSREVRFVFEISLMVSPVIEQGATGREVRFVFGDINP